VRGVRSAQDLARDLSKVFDVVEAADQHFRAEAQMNAALHMNPNVRPAPLAVAMAGARDDLDRIITELNEEAKA
jgi:hypothetical protein